MRKILGNPALEAELKAQAEAEAVEKAETEQRVALENISLEEQQALLDEAHQSADDAAAGLQEVDRVTEVSDALEDLAIIAGDIKEPTEGEVALMGNAAQMAVAGTDVPAEEVVPALEGIDDWKAKASTLGATIKAKAKDIWEKIMAFLRKIWGQIQEFFYRIFDTIPRLQKVLSEQQKALTASKLKGHGKFVPGKIKMNIGYSALMLAEGGPAVDSDKLKLGFDSLNSYCEYVFGKYADAVKARGEALAKVIAGFDWGNTLASADAVVGAVSAHKLPVPSSNARSGGTQGDYTVIFTKGTLGGLSITHKVVADSALANANALRRLELLRGETVEISRASSGQAGGAYEVEVLSPDTAVTLVKEGQDVLKKLEGWKKSGLKALTEVQKKLEAASNKASEMAKTDKEAIPKDIDVALYRGALNFNTAFTKWTSEPAVTLTRGALASVRALSILVDKSLASYEVQGSLDNLPAKTAAAAA